jgi:mono/diheme cytochrome c family protein
MTRFLVIALLTAVTALGTEVISSSTSDQAAATTFNKSVLPVLQKNCQSCHRPGGVAPMSFMTYESTRPWAKAIREAVLSKKMPPWFADPAYGVFRNAPQLKEADIHTLGAWADTGALEGNAADKPADISWTDGWLIQPDVVVSMPEPYRIAARGIGEVKEFFIENPFKEDTWVSSIEIRPGDPSVVHHVILQIPDREEALGNVTIVSNPGTDRESQMTFLGFTRLPTGQGGVGSYSSGVIARFKESDTGKGSFTTMEAIYAPGTSPQDFRYTNAAKLIRGGKPIRIEMHYTPNGKETTDQTKIGFTLAKAPAQRRFVIMAPEHMVDPRKPIPQNDPNYETVGQLTFNQDVDLVWFMPHMHLRGKDMTYKLIFPDGREQTVLSARFNFNWQLGYELEKPIKVPKDTRLVVTSHHDNSANNPLNPSSSQMVQWGEMTSQEMMLPWFGVIVDREATPDMIATYVPPDLDSLPKVKVFQRGLGIQIQMTQPQVNR